MLYILQMLVLFGARGLAVLERIEAARALHYSDHLIHVSLYYSFYTFYGA